MASEAAGRRAWRGVFWGFHPSLLSSLFALRVCLWRFFLKSGLLSLQGEGERGRGVFALHGCFCGLLSAVSCFVRLIWSDPLLAHGDDDGHLHARVAWSSFLGVLKSLDGSGVGQNGGENG